jgi:hypothetical protein|tara:strand:+ start:2636 stop:3100 length:465 start_codon:yes stop_codon:yes gene_type:complete
MRIVLNEKNFDINNALIGVKSTNNVMQEKNSNFYKMYYSDEFHTTYGISILFELSNIKTIIHYDKFKCVFSDSSNKYILNKLCTIEKKILNKFSHLNKQTNFKILEQIKNNYIKTFYDKKQKPSTHKKIKFILKISGIWETTYEYGLTFKFIMV